jgi:hypothetical protein
MTPADSATKFKQKVTGSVIYPSLTLGVPCCVLSQELEMSGGPLTRNDENVGQPARNRARKQADTYPRSRSLFS